MDFSSDWINEDTKVHRDWQHSRLNFILELYPKNFWNKKRVLELGSFNGVIGNYFRELGSEVLSIEGRPSNIRRIQEEFPELNIIKGDLDRVDWHYGYYDIIINLGLLYHLEQFHKEHLLNCLDNCDLLLLESVIYDSEKPELYVREEGGYGQSLSGIGKTPSTSFVENILGGTKFRKYSNSSLNSGPNIYDWTDTYSKIFNPYLRRFWTVERL